MSRYQERETDSTALLHHPEWVLLGTRCPPTREHGFDHRVWASACLTQAELRAKVTWTEDIYDLEPTHFAPRKLVFHLNAQMQQTDPHTGQATVMCAYGHSYSEAIGALMSTGNWDPDAARPAIGLPTPELLR